MDNPTTTNWHGQFYDVDNNEALKPDEDMPFF